MVQGFIISNLKSDAFSPYSSLFYFSFTNLDQVPAWYLATQQTPFDWAYTSKSSNRSCKASRKGCFLPRGKMLGGNGAMNIMLYVEGNEEDFQYWPKTTRTWNWNDVMPYYEKVRNGLMSIEQFTSPINSLSQVILDAGSEKGFTQSYAHRIGYRFADGTISNGARHSAAKAHLMPEKSNLHIIKKAVVTKIMLNKSGRATGVEFQYNDTDTITVTATKEVLLTAGPIANPQILVLSGIGIQNTLTKLNIKVIKPLPVGKHLQDIIYVPLYFQFHTSTATPLTKHDILDNVYLYAVNRTGGLSGHEISNLIAHWSTEANTERPDIQVTHKYFPTNAFDLQFYLTISGYIEMVGRQILDNNQRSEILIMNIGLMRPKSEGTVSLTSNNPLKNPKLRTKYLENSDDMSTMLKALKQAASFVNTKEFIKHEGKLLRMPLPACKDIEYQTDKYWRCYAASMTRSAGRQFGTTRMGADEKDSVVDGRLKVHGVDGLRVVGSSVLPISAGGQSNSATLMMAERAADFVKADWMGKQQRVEL